MSKFEVFNNIIGKNVNLPMSMGNDVKDLVRGLLAKNPHERISFAGVKQSSWLSQACNDQTTA
jgi:serine/threonine protein kinase